MSEDAPKKKKLDHNRRVDKGLLTCHTQMMQSPILRYKKIICSTEDILGTPF